MVDIVVDVNGYVGGDDGGGDYDDVVSVVIVPVFVVVLTDVKCCLGRFWNYFLHHKVRCRSLLTKYKLVKLIF